MRAEALTYPCVTGEYGIDFSKYIQDFEKKGLHCGIVKGESGAELELEAFENSLKVVDKSNPDRGMEAIVTNGVFSFSVQTRRRITDECAWGDTPHPDMFAARFVRFAIAYFGENGEEVTICQGEWGPYSDNWLVFNDEYGRHGNKARAAKATWSGKLFASMGFSQLRSRDVEISYKEHGVKEEAGTGDKVKKPVIIARFRRPKSKI